MKTIRLLTVILLLAAAAYAGGKKSTPANGGYTGPSAVQASTVAQARKMKDDALVILEGRIESHLRNDKYLFRDATDTITVEIDKKIWNGLSVGAKDTIILRGEIDKELFSVEIEVKSLIKK